MEWWKIFYWLAGTLGIAGTIALFVFVPNVAGIIFRAVVKFFSFVLSYRVGCALVAALVVGFAVDYWRHSRDDADFAAKTAAFEAAQDARDKRIADDTRASVTAEIANQQKQDDGTNQEVKEFHDTLPPIPALGNPFAVGSDRDRLRIIAGQAVSKPASAKRVSAPRRASPRPGDRK